MPLPSEPQKALGRAIRALRDERGLTQEALAHAAKMSPGAVSRVENGSRNPTWGTVKRISKALGVELAELAARSEELERRELGKT